METRPTKQIVIIRKDLKMRRGKEIAQGAHASMGALLSLMEWYDPFGQNIDEEKTLLLVKDDEPIRLWLKGSFTKIAVTAQTEQELIELELKAKEKGFPCCLITDNGKTEFAGIPTKTALAIGPWWSEEIDEITRHLPLY